MKLTTNFISRPGRSAPYIAIGLWGLSAMLVVAAVLMWVRTGQLYSEAPALKARLAQFNDRLAVHDEVALPPYNELMAVKESIASINQVSGSHNGSLLAAMSKLEALLPHDVTLTEFNYRRRAGELQMVALAARSEVAGKFLQELERSGHYAEVLLVRQSNQDNNSARVQFEIHLKERP